MIELEFDTYGTGAYHALAWANLIGVVCPRCDGRKVVGPASFPCTCPQCHGTGKVLQRPERVD
jgi:DnaJ-class molecular chaperone